MQKTVLLSICTILFILIYIRIRSFSNRETFLSEAKDIFRAVNDYDKLKEAVDAYSTIECDARITADHQVILYHDSMIDGKKVNTLTVNQIEALIRKPVLTLSFLLQSYKGTVIVEMKGWNKDLINGIGNAIGSRKNVAVTTFHPFALLHFKSKFPKIAIGYMWCKNCVDYLDPADDEFQLPKILDYKPLRVIVDFLYNLTGRYVAVLLGAQLVGLEDIDVNASIVEFFKWKNISIFVWNWKARISKLDLERIKKKYNVSICVSK